jgi:hypothetical protein
MNANADLRLAWPLVAMVALVLATWIRLYVERLGEMRERRIHPQRVATQQLAAGVLTRNRAADHFRNLFEVPVLFYAGVVATLALQLRSDLLLGIAWAFVAARVAHALIHLGYNRVTHRFAAYVTSCVAVFAYWAVFALLVARA